jgi:hypothetical protein
MEDSSSLRNQKPHPFDFPLGFARGFGKTGQALSLQERRDKDEAPPSLVVEVKIRDIDVCGIPLLAKDARNGAPELVVEVKIRDIDVWGIPLLAKDARNGAPALGVEIEIRALTFVESHFSQRTREMGHPSLW